MLFHKSLGFPKGIKLPAGRKRLVLTNHARMAAQNDRYGSFAHLLSLHTSFDPANAELIEIESDDKIHVGKALYRVPLAPNSKLDVVLAAVPYRDSYVVKTLWINERTDKHRTLKVERYTKP